MSDTKTWKEWAADPSIDFWDVNEDSDTLTHEALEESVELYIDDWAEGPDVEACLRNRLADGLKVYGWKRKTVDPKWLANEAERLAERFFEESWCEEYGNLHERERAAEANLATAFLGAMEENLPEPWQCERVATVTIPLDELIAMLRESNPEWFEKGGADRKTFAQARKDLDKLSAEGIPE